MGEFAMSRRVNCAYNMKIVCKVYLSSGKNLACCQSHESWILNSNKLYHRLSCALIWVLAAGVMCINGYFVITYLQLLPHSIPVYVLVTFFLIVYLSLVSYLGYMAVKYNTQQRPYLVNNVYIHFYDLASA